MKNVLFLTFGLKTAMALNGGKEASSCLVEEIGMLNGLMLYFYVSVKNVLSCLKLGRY